MKLYLVSALAVFLMAGCGGSSSPKGSDQKKTTSLKGIAVDDLIINGKVRAYAARTSKELAKGRTDNGDGSYVLNIAYDGVVIVEVTCDSQSKMLNPDTGLKKDCIQGLELNSAAIVKNDSEEIKVNISPLSELVVRQMKESGTTSKESLQAAQNNIGGMFGFDPLGQSPVENDQYKKVIGAIHTMADKNSSKTILDIIDDLNADYKDGEAGDDGSVSSDFAKVMKDAGVTNNLTLRDGVYIPPVIDTSKSDIELSKEFFNELRTQAMSVVNYKESGTPGFLDKEAESLGNVLKDVTFNAGIAGEYTVEITKQILEAIDSNKTTSVDNIEDSEIREVNVTRTTDTSIWEYSVKDEGTEKYSGTVTLPQETPADISADDFTNLSARFEGTVPLKRIEDASDTGEQNFVTNMLLSKTTEGADFTLSNATLTSESDSVEISNLLISTGYDYNSTSKKVTFDNVKFNSLTFSGEASGYSMSGTIAVAEYVVNSSLADKDFMEENYGDTDFYNSGNIPKKITFAGNITNTQTEASIEGEISVDLVNAAAIDKDVKPLIDIAVTGKIKMPERPEMILNLGFENSATENDFTFNYAYGSTSITGTGDFDQEVDNGTVILSSHNGLSATLKIVEGDVVYGSQSNIKRNGSLVGIFEDMNGVPRVKYTDGSFETLP